MSMMKKKQKENTGEIPKCLFLLEIRLHDSFYENGSIFYVLFTALEVYYNTSYVKKYINIRVISATVMI